MLRTDYHGSFQPLWKQSVKLNEVPQLHLRRQYYAVGFADFDADVVALEVDRS